MKKTIFFLGLFILLCSFNSDTFKSDQLKNSRVKEAYKSKQNIINSLLKAQNISNSELHVYLRIFKHEKITEVWGKNKSDKNYKLIKTYNICNSSGTLGPKRKQGDGQVPEGFYHINAFNPWSSYHLSMMVNYPNKSDKILGYKPNLGGLICIHGSCVTIGCIPLTDNYIKEVYIFCVEAKNNGQANIPVSIYPCKMNTATLASIKNKKQWSKETLNLWEDLKVSYDIFENNKTLPTISFLENGRHKVTK